MSVLSCVNTTSISHNQPHFREKRKNGNIKGAFKIAIKDQLMTFVDISTFFPPTMNHLTFSQHNSVSEILDHTIQVEYAEREVDVVYKDTDYMRLKQISHLPDDWNGYGAKSFSSTLVEKCKSIFLALTVAPHIYPTGRQSIQFQYELPDRSYLEFEIFENRTICLLVPQRQYSRAETKEFTSHETEQIREMVIKFYE